MPAELTEYFPAGTTYNVCVYLVEPVVATGLLDSADVDGVVASLPLDGQYRIDVTGTWQNGSWWRVDAEWVEQYDEGERTGQRLHLVAGMARPGRGLR